MGTFFLHWRRNLSLAAVLVGLGVAVPMPREPQAAGVSTAARGWSCHDYFSYFVYGYEPPRPSPEEKRVFREWLKGDGATYFYPAKLNDDLFWESFSQLPILVQDRLAQLPTNRAAAQRYFSDLAAELGMSYLPRSFAENILERYQDRTWRDKTTRPVADWVRAGLAAHETRLTALPALAVALKAEHAQLVQEVRAQDAWIHAFEMPVPYEKFGRDGVRVTIGRDVYSGVIRGNAVLLRVPSAKMAHPAWNPLNEKHLVDMIEAKVPMPDAWDVYLGHDGTFYIHDGNHRFAMYGKSEAWVRLSFPPRTVPLRNYLDLWGVSQPGSEQILKLHRKEVGFWDLMPAHAKGRVILYPR